MTDRDREAFDKYLRDYGVEGSHMEAWCVWQACAAHYAPKLTDGQAVEKAAEIIEPAFFGESAKSWEPDHAAAMREEARSKAKAALRAAGVKFREEG